MERESKGALTRRQGFKASYKKKKIIKSKRKIQGHEHENSILKRPNGTTQTNQFNK